MDRWTVSPFQRPKNNKHLSGGEKLLLLTKHKHRFQKSDNNNEATEWRSKSSLCLLIRSIFLSYFVIINFYKREFILHSTERITFLLHFIFDTKMMMIICNQLNDSYYNFEPVQCSVFSHQSLLALTFSSPNSIARTYFCA